MKISLYQIIYNGKDVDYSFIKSLVVKRDVNFE